MNKESLIEKIGAIKNEMSHIWGAAFVLGGGTVTLITTGVDVLKSAFVISGVVLTVLFINAYFIRRQELKRFLKELED